MTGSRGCLSGCEKGGWRGGVTGCALNAHTHTHTGLTDATPAANSWRKPLAGCRLPRRPSPLFHTWPFAAQDSLKGRAGCARDGTELLAWMSCIQQLFAVKKKTNMLLATLHGGEATVNGERRVGAMPTSLPAGHSEALWHHIISERESAAFLGCPFLRHSF